MGAYRHVQRRYWLRILQQPTDRYHRILRQAHKRFNLWLPSFYQPLSLRHNDRQCRRNQQQRYRTNHQCHPSNNKQLHLEYNLKHCPQQKQRGVTIQWYLFCELPWLWQSRRRRLCYYQCPETDGGQPGRSVLRLGMGRLQWRRRFHLQWLWCRGKSDRHHRCPGWWRSPQSWFCTA